MRREDMFLDILGGLDEKYVALAMPRPEGYDLKTERRNVIEIAPEKPDKRAVRRYRIIRAAALSAAAAIILVGIGFIFGFLRAGQIASDYAPPSVYSRQGHSATWRSAEEATGLKFGQLTDKEKLFDKTAEETDAEAETREYKVHAMWYKFDGKTLIVRCDVTCTSFFYFGKAWSEMPVLSNHSQQMVFDYLQYNKNIKELKKGIWDVIGVDGRIWELVYKIELDDYTDSTDVYVLKYYDGENNYDDPYLFTAHKTFDAAEESPEEQPDNAENADDETDVPDDVVLTLPDGKVSRTFLLNYETVGSEGGVPRLSGSAFSNAAAADGAGYLQICYLPIETIMRDIRENDELSELYGLLEPYADGNGLSYEKLKAELPGTEIYHILANYGFDSDYGCFRVNDEYIIYISDALNVSVFQKNAYYTACRKALEILWENYEVLKPIAVTAVYDGSTDAPDPENDRLRITASAGTIELITNTLAQNDIPTDLFEYRIYDPENSEYEHDPAFDLLGRAFFDADGSFRVSNAEWELSTDYGLFRKYFFGTWYSGDHSVVFDDTEGSFFARSLSVFFGDFYKVGGNVLVFLMGGSAGGEIWWLDMNEPDTLYTASGTPGVEAPNSIYISDFSPDIGKYTKTDAAINEPENGYLSVFRLRELAAGYEIPPELITDIEIQGEDITMNHDDRYYAYPVYLISEEPDRIVLETALGNGYFRAGNVTYSIEKDESGQWVRKITSETFLAND